MNELALFAGAGGGILGGNLLGWNCIGAVEIERYPREVLLARQRDGILPRFPIWDDVRSFDGNPWRGLVDVVSGGFPCQDISCAGKGAGITGERSGLWKEMCRIICEVRPRFAFMENSPMLASRGLGTVLGDLAEAGYDAAWMCLSAADCGAPHRRERIWILAKNGMAAPGEKGRNERLLPERGSQALAMSGAYGANVPNPAESGCKVCIPSKARSIGSASAETPNEPGSRGANVPHAHEAGREEQRQQKSTGAKHPAVECGMWWQSEPDVGRVADGVAHRVDRLAALGNGQVPIVAATAFRILYKELTGKDYEP